MWPIVWNDIVIIILPRMVAFNEIFLMPFSIMMIFTGLVTTSLLFFALLTKTVNNLYFRKDNDHHPVPLLSLPGAALCLQKKPLLQVSIILKGLVNFEENFLDLWENSSSPLLGGTFTMICFWLLLVENFSMRSLWHKQCQGRCSMSCGSRWRPWPTAPSAQALPRISYTRWLYMWIV